MKKILCLLGVLLLIGLVINGCAPEKAGAPEKLQEKLAETKGDAKDVQEKPAEPKEAAKAESGEKAGSSISKADLDKLKADIGGLEADDLGGLSS